MSVMIPQTFRLLPIRFLKRKPIAKSFSRNEDGATAVEFAIIAVPFLGLIAAIFETGLMFFASQSLQTAVTEGTRAIMIGDAQADGSLRSSNVFASKYICPLLPSAMFTCSSLKVDVNVVGNFSQNYGAIFSTNIQSAGTQFCIGKRGDIILVRALYPMPVFMKILALDASGNTSTITAGLSQNPNTGAMDTRVLMGTAVFRNEPFMTAVQTAC